MRTSSGRDPGQPEDGELPRLDRRDAYLADDLAGLDDLGGARLGAALDEIRLVRGFTSQRAVAPTAVEEVLDLFAQLLPQPFVIRLEDRPACALIDRGGQVEEDPAHGKVAPLRVARERARAPDADALPREGPDRVDAGLGELGLVVLHHIEPEPRDS